MSRKDRHIGRSIRVENRNPCIRPPIHVRTGSGADGNQRCGSASSLEPPAVTDGSRDAVFVEMGLIFAFTGCYP